MANEFIAGAYTVTLGGATIGQTGQGIQIDHSFFKQLIVGDNWADTPQDAVFRGAQLFVQTRLIQWNAASVRLAMWPYGASWLALGPVGRIDVQQSLVASMILTAVTGTPAQTLAAPASITFGNSILAEGYSVQQNFAPALREVPIRHRIYPSLTGQTSAAFGSMT